MASPESVKDWGVAEVVSVGSDTPELGAECACPEAQKTWQVATVGHQMKPGTGQPLGNLGKLKITRSLGSDQNRMDC